MPREGRLSDLDLERLTAAALSGFDRIDHPVTSVVLTLGVFWFRGHLARRTARDNAAAQLFSIQRHLADIAFGRGGGAKLPEHVSKTLSDQFIARVDEVKAQARAAGLSRDVGPAIDLYRESVKTFFEHWQGYTYATDNMRGWYGRTKRELHAALRALGRYRAFKRKIETDEDGESINDPDSVRGDEVATFDRNQMGYTPQSDAGPLNA